MLLLAFLYSPSVFVVLATIGIVDCTFHRLPVAGLHPVLFPFFVYGTAVLLPSGRDGMEQKRHHFFGGYCSPYKCLIQHPPSYPKPSATIKKTALKTTRNLSYPKILSKILTLAR